jgi:Tfp pilus assembly protein PilE
MKVFNASKSRSLGITLVELLLVVTVLMVLAGVLLSVINYKRHVQRADDAVRRATLQKIVNAVEMYYQSEKQYPSSVTDPALSTYMRGVWPDNQPPGAIYFYNVNTARDGIGIVVTLNTSGHYLKYRTSFHQIRECGSPCVPDNDICLATSTP